MNIITQLKILILKLMLKINVLKVEQLNASLTKIMDKNDRLYTRAARMLGTDASPKDEVEDDLSCVDSLEDIYYSEFGKYIGEKKIASTLQLYRTLKYNPSFKETDTPKPGNIIVAVTASSPRGVIHGHTGIIGKYGIMSSDSRSGLWLENYSLDSFHLYFTTKLGLPVYIFELV